MDRFEERYRSHPVVCRQGSKHLFVGMVGMNCRDDSLDRIVAEDRAHSDLHAEFELVPLAS